MLISTCCATVSALQGHPMALHRLAGFFQEQYSQVQAIESIRVQVCQELPPSLPCVAPLAGLPASCQCSAACRALACSLPSHHVPPCCILSATLLPSSAPRLPSSLPGQGPAQAGDHDWAAVSRRQVPGHRLRGHAAHAGELGPAWGSAAAAAAAPATQCMRASGERRRWQRATHACGACNATGCATRPTSNQTKPSKSTLLSPAGQQAGHRLHRGHGADGGHRLARPV